MFTKEKFTELDRKCYRKDLGFCRISSLSAGEITDGVDDFIQCSKSVEVDCYSDNLLK